MANPKRKHSKARSAKRRASNFNTEMPTLTVNRQHGGEAFTLPHNATPDGFYKGRRLPGFRDRRPSQGA
jgi:ribosomal protein L32